MSCQLVLQECLSSAVLEWNGRRLRRKRLRRDDKADEVTGELHDIIHRDELHFSSTDVSAVSNSLLLLWLKHSNPLRKRWVHERIVQLRYRTHTRRGRIPAPAQATIPVLVPRKRIAIPRIAQH
jgi:hypothetical protein